MLLQSAQGAAGGISGVLIVLGIIAAGAVAWLIARAIRATGQNPEADIHNGTCGRCGYSVAGLTGLSCPECGSDLRTVGIAPPTAGRSRTTAMTLFVFVVGGICLFLLLAFFVIAMPASRPAPPALAPTATDAAAPVDSPAETSPR